MTYTCTFKENFTHYAEAHSSDNNGPFNNSCSFNNYCMLDNSAKLLFDRMKCSCFLTTLNKQTVSLKMLHLSYLLSRTIWKIHSISKFLNHPWQKIDNSWKNLFQVAPFRNPSIVHPGFIVFFATWYHQSSWCSNVYAQIDFYPSSKIRCNSILWLIVSFVRHFAFNYHQHTS